MSKGCNHKWQDFGAYKKCLVCGCIDMSSKMAAIQGIVSEVEDCEDEVLLLYNDYFTYTRAL